MNNILKIAQKIAEINLKKKRELDSRTHISIIVSKKRILSIGTNSIKTHTKAQALGYPLEMLHSEVDAIIRLPKNYKNKPLLLYNFRFSQTGKLGMSKPCKYCLPWCQKLFDKIVFSNENGQMVDYV